ncbi:hypothetical protein CK203_110141 [Vitis vinifera]|uniref:Bifunctional inhibitor/plant lipid transfer protein/seed storage helical domain-containing protein n=1 Tax=Vitis vinifera TaxID=29760 RepID=A0A438CB39_VITVI|nr:hypothetical protein CK203_110141 [Vitis vinifera]
MAMTAQHVFCSPPAIWGSPSATVSTAVTCSPMELSTCANAIISSSPPTATCCSKLKEQRSCLANPHVCNIVDQCLGGAPRPDGLNPDVEVAAQEKPNKPMKGLFFYSLKPIPSISYELSRYSTVSDKPAHWATEGGLNLVFFRLKPTLSKTGLHGVAAWKEG